MEKQQQLEENFPKPKHRGQKAGGIVLLMVTVILAALVLGWYILDDRPGPVTVRPLADGARRGASAPLDLNTATAEELDMLPEIGPVLAERIVAWREEQGPFRTPEDVLAVPGVGPAVYAAIGPYIGAEQEDGS